MLRIKHLYFEIQLNCHYTVTPLFCYLPTACCTSVQSQGPVFNISRKSQSVLCLVTYGHTGAPWMSVFWQSELLKDVGCEPQVLRPIVHFSTNMQKMQGRTQRSKKTGGSSLCCQEGSALLYREWSGFSQKCGPLMHSTVQKQPQLWLQVIEKPRNLGERTEKKEEKGGTQLQHIHIHILYFNLYPCIPAI